jgi:hypothetical protein
MLAANLIFLALALGLVVLAVRGLSGSWPMQVASFVVLALSAVTLVWAVLNTLKALTSDPPDDIARGLIGYVIVISPIIGLGLAFLAFVKCGPVAVPRYFHLLGLLSFLLAAIMVISDWKESSTLSNVLAIVVPFVWVLAWLVPYLLLRGKVDPAAYATAPSAFKLPFPSGERTWIIQGNNSSFNHNHGNYTQGFAWDFRRPCGTPVLAALAGTVTSVIHHNDGIGGDNNEVEIRHADGSVASYLHILHNSAQVAVGAVVSQGDRLASVGSVGHSLTGHIHFHVRVGPDTVPVKFADVTRHDGIPRGFRFYTSGNP